MFRSSHPSSTTELAHALARSLPDLRRAAWLSLAGALLVLVPAAYMFEVYERVVNSRSGTTLAMLTLLVAGAFAVMALLDWARMQVLQHAGHALDRRMGERVFRAMFDAAAARAPGGSAQAMADLATVREFLGSPPALAALEVPAAAMLLACMWVLHPLLGGACLAGALLHGLLAWAQDRATTPALAGASHQGAAARQELAATVRAAAAADAMGLHSPLRARWLARQHQLLALQCLASDRAAAVHAMGRLVQVALPSILVGLGAWLLVRGDLAAGAGLVVASSILGGRVVAPLLAVLLHWRAVAQAWQAWGRLAQLLEGTPAPTSGMPLPPPRGSLLVEHVFAGPPGVSAPVLRGVTFALQPGDLLAVVGPSGAGKSVLARVLVGGWPCAGGAVRLDRADVHRWDREALAPHLGYLPQEASLFEGSVAENIARFGPADLERLHAAAMAAGVHDFIQALPRGYDTPLGADGARLSGGERQRIALARALYGSPQLVVLDEPDASLDAAGDAALVAALQALKAGGATVIVVTHRAGVLRCADKVLLLREGRVHAFGPREEVLRTLAEPVAQAALRAAKAAAHLPENAPA